LRRRHVTAADRSEDQRDGVACNGGDPGLRAGVAAGCGATAAGCGATAAGCGATAAGCGATAACGANQPSCGSVLATIALAASP